MQKCEILGNKLSWLQKILTIYFNVKIVPDNQFNLE